MNQIFTTPFEWIAVWLRKLSLSGNSGNCIAIILYIIICCLPAIAFLLLCLRKKKIRADYLLLVCSAALFIGIYLMINPGLMTPYFRYSIPMINLAISTTLWSIFICYIILRVLAIIRYANEINLAKIAQVFIILVMIISSEDGAVMLDNGSMRSFQSDRIPLLLCDLVPSLLFIWVLIASFRLCRSLKDNHFTDQTIQDAGALSHLCVRVLCITAVLEVVRNILQLLMLPSLSDTTFTVSLPIIEILLTVTAFILAKKFETAHTLEEENEAFI